MTLKQKIEQVLSEIVSDRHECEVTIKFERERER